MAPGHSAKPETKSLHISTRQPSLAKPERKCDTAVSPEVRTRQLPSPTLRIVMDCNGSPGPPCYAATGRQKNGEGFSFQPS